LMVWRKREHYVIMRNRGRIKLLVIWRELHSWRR